MTALGPDDLSAPQRAVYEANDSRLLVVGGPGTGKTLVALLAARRVVEQDDRGRRALFLTFSRSATSELIRRAGGLLRGSVGERVEVTTFHGFAVGVLEAYRRYVGGSSDSVSIATPEEISLDVAPEGATQFGALVPETIALFKTAPWIFDLYRDRLGIVVCDEFQDTHEDQLALLEMLAQGRRLICLADPEQMIFDGLPGNASVATRISSFRETEPAEVDLGSSSYRDPTQVIPRAAAALRDRTLDDGELSQAIDSGVIRVITSDDPQERALLELQASIGAGAQSVGVFLSVNRQVADFADRLRREGIDHDIAGLGSASGEAELAIASLAETLVGETEWDTFLMRLGVFLASATRGTPPPMAHSLAGGSSQLDNTLLRLLTQERDRMQTAAEGSISEFLLAGRSLWANVFAGRNGRRLWEGGIDDLAAETAGIGRQPLNDETVRQLRVVARRRRAMSTWDTLPGLDAPVQIMNLYQVKGRQMDVSIVVRELDDREPSSASDRKRVGRLMYVAVSRARQSSKIILPTGVGGYFASYATLAR